MARLKLHIPEAFAFETEIPLRISDINYGGHLGNDAVLSLIHEARVRYLTSLGYSEIDIEGTSIIMSDAHIVFRSEGFYGDTLLIRVTPGPPEGVRFDLFYALMNKATGKEVARARTEITFFDYGSRKAVQVPERFISRIGRQ